MVTDASERLAGQVQENSLFYLKWGWLVGLASSSIVWATCGDLTPAAIMLGGGGVGVFAWSAAAWLLPNTSATIATCASGAIFGLVAWRLLLHDCGTSFVMLGTFLSWGFVMIAGNAPVRALMYAWAIGFAVVLLPALVSNVEQPFSVVAVFAFAIAFSLLDGERSHRQRQSLAISAAQSRHAGSVDELTGLMNRRALFERLERTRAAGMRGIYAYLDLDNFKAINDIYGHQTGDEMLRAIAERLRQSLPAETIVARIGGDEFVVDCAEFRDAEEGAQQIVDAFAQPFVLAGSECWLSVSVGAIALQAGAQLGADDLINTIDAAMYKSKRSGGNSFVVSQLEPDG